MNRILLPGIIVAALLNCTVALTTASPQNPSEVSQSAEAVQARLKYEVEIQKLNTDYSIKLNRVRQQYAKDLDIVRKKALEKEDLDEAQRLLEEKKDIETSSQQPGVTKGMGILCALWGYENKWMDVTPTLRGAVKNSQLHFSLTKQNPLSAVPDPASGVRKTLMIAYTLDGKPYLSLTRDDQSIDLTGK